MIDNWTFMGLVNELSAANAKVKELQEALQWCGGSNDFGPGGIAEKGWLKIRHLCTDTEEK